MEEEVAGRFRNGCCGRAGDIGLFGLGGDERCGAVVGGGVRCGAVLRCKS